MKQLLYFLLVCTLLSSCRGSRTQTQHFGKIKFNSTAEPAEPKITPPADTAASNQPKKNLIERIFAAGKSETQDVPWPDGEPIRLPKKFKGTINYYATGSTVSTVGKKATAATGQGATATAVETKAPTAVGTGAVAQDFTKQGQRGGAAASGDGAQATNTSKGFNWWLVLIPAALYGVWYLVAGTVWGKLTPWLPSRRWRWLLAVVFAGVAYFLLKAFA